MVERQTPQDYFGHSIQDSEYYKIPKWVPLLIGIALVGAFVVAVYAISKVK